MPFVKLDCEMLNSTLWFERICREIFITALLMAEPHEILQEESELMVRELKRTGWTIPPGWYGLVPSSGPGIIHRAMIEDFESGVKALEQRAMPEPESRSKDFEGRRMVRIDGGYIILNYMKYRDRDYTAAERQRRLRERRKNEASHRNNVTVTRDPSRIAESRMQSAESDILKLTSEDTGVQGVKRRSAPVSVKPSADFLRFWDAYPRKQAMKPAWKSWQKLNPEIEPTLAALEKQKRTIWKNSEKQHIPLAATWLNQERWDDEV